MTQQKKKQQTYTIEELANMSWNKWTTLFMEDLATITRMLGLDWTQVKSDNQALIRGNKHQPHKIKIASYLRKVAISQHQKQNSMEKSK